MAGDRKRVNFAVCINWQSAGSPTGALLATSKAGSSVVRGRKLFRKFRSLFVPEAFIFGAGEKLSSQMAFAQVLTQHFIRWCSSLDVNSCQDSWWTLQRTLALPSSLSRRHQGASGGRCCMFSHTNEKEEEAMPFLGLVGSINQSLLFM